MDTASPLPLDLLSALEAENAVLKARLQACEQSYALLQAEVTELRRHPLDLAAVESPAKPLGVAVANQILKRNLDLLSTDPDLDRFVGHVLSAIAQQFQSPLTEYWSQDDHTAYIELMYWEGRIMNRADIAQAFPYHVGLEGFRVPPAMIDDIPLRHRKKTIVYEDHSTNPFTKDLAWVIQGLVPLGLPREINVPLFLGVTTIGALTIHVPANYQFKVDQVELAQALAHQVTLAVEMQRLAEEAKQVAIFEERNRIASDIHDTLAQTFTGISLQLEVAKPLIVQEPKTVEHILQHISQLAKNGLAEARNSIWALYPPGAEYANLAQKLYDSVEQMSRNTPISIQVNLLGHPCPLAPYIGMNLLRIGQEALTNALKHSLAQTVVIELIYMADMVSLSIRDDGRGFTPPLNLEHLNGGFGLVGMYERCDRIGAALTILSQPGQGTQILVESPLV